MGANSNRTHLHERHIARCGSKGVAVIIEIRRVLYVG